MTLGNISSTCFPMVSYSVRRDFSRKFLFAITTRRLRSNISIDDGIHEKIIVQRRSYFLSDKLILSISILFKLFLILFSPRRNKMVRRPGTGTQKVEFVQAGLEVVKSVFKLIQRILVDQII